MDGQANKGSPGEEVFTNLRNEIRMMRRVKELVEGGSSREGGSGDKQGSKVVSPAATAVTFDQAATGWTLPTYSPKLPTLATHTNMSMTEVCQRIGPVSLDISFSHTVQEY